MSVAGATALVNDCAGGKPSNLDSPKMTSISVSWAFLSSLSYFNLCSSRCGWAQFRTRWFNLRYKNTFDFQSTPKIQITSSLYSLINHRRTSIALAIKPYIFKFQEECVNVHGLNTLWNVYRLNCAFAHDTQCQPEDKDKMPKIPNICYILKEQEFQRYQIWHSDWSTGQLFVGQAHTSYLSQAPQAVPV